MKNFKLLSQLFLLVLFIPALAQVQVDKQIQLTGNGADARITGIQSVTNTQDATSVQVIQNGSLVYAVATGSNNNFSIIISPAITALQAGMVFNFISNQSVTGPATLSVNDLSPAAIKKSVNQDFTGCEIQNGQFVTVVYDGTNFQMTSAFASQPPTAANAGSSQSNLTDTVIELGANIPQSGTGMWSIVSGTGGSFSNVYNPFATFTALSGNTYVLSWTITSCVSSSSNITLSFIPHGAQTFSSTGAEQTFTVPAGVSSVMLNVYGAQGGSSTYNSTTNVGGLGGYATGTLNVTAGELLYVYVGATGNPSNIGGGSFNGGGEGGYDNSTSGGGGSDIRVGGTALSNRVIVAGGGGGVTGANYYTSSAGSGGGTTGGNGTGTLAAYGGQGGTQSKGGNGSSEWGEQVADEGTLGQGGNTGQQNGGGGGGGGYYGGGGGDQGGGGGGSGYIGGVNNGSMQSGIQSGNGEVIISWGN